MARVSARKTHPDHKAKTAEEKAQRAHAKREKRDLLGRIDRLLRARPRLSLSVEFEPADEHGGEAFPAGFGARFIDMEDPCLGWAGSSRPGEGLTLEAALAAALDEAEAQ